MDEIFHDLIQGGYITVYLDNILIYSRTMDEHILICKEVLNRLQLHSLFLKPEKCDWFKKEIEYLGHIVSENSIKMDIGKVKAIIDWEAPKTKKGLQSFLGFANYYRRFIPHYGTIVEPLTKLMGKAQ